MDSLNEDFSEFARLLEEAWERRVSVAMNGLQLKFIGKKDLIVNKRAVGRPKDQIDLLELTQPL